MERKEPRIEEIEELRDKADFEALLGILKYREDTETRVAAMRAMREVDPEKAADAAYGFVSDRNQTVSREALRTLAELGDPRCLALIKPLVYIPETFERREAVEILKAYVKPDAVPVLYEFIEDMDDDISSAAYDTIREMGEAAVPFLLEALDPNSNRFNAAELLADLRSERSVEPLLARLRRAEGYDRYHVIRTLRFFSLPETVELLAPALSDGVAESR